MNYHSNYRPGLGIAESYAVVCPDILDVNIENHPELSGPHPVGIDGRIDLQSLGRPRVEGEAIPAIVRQLAELADVPMSKVHVRVAEFQGQWIYVFGEVMGVPRAVPYKGQETILELLQRTGGITPGAEPEGVYVVRSHVGDAKRPEVFHVDLKAIVMKHDERTNLRLEPFDQVHVAETRRAGIQKVLPPWMRKIGAAVNEKQTGG